jgi:glutaminase
MGMPAKSGVTGGVIAVLPGQLGIGVFSPPLDTHGNSVRGIRACEDLSRFFDLHLLNTPHTSQSVIRLKFTAAEFNSGRVRSSEESEVLRAHGDGIHVYQLQGHLLLSTAEVVVHDAMAAIERTEALILDLKHVVAANESASRLLCKMVVRFHEQGRQVLFTHLSRAPQLRRYLKAKLKEDAPEGLLSFEDGDAALEWCENRLLERLIPGAGGRQPLQPVDYEPFAGLEPDEFATVHAMLERRHYRPGQVIVEIGAPAGELFILARGRASVTLPLSGGARKRLATFSPGMAFGEMAMLDRAPRSAVVTADTDVECDLLKIEDIDHLATTHPQITIVLFRNLAFSLSRKLRKANREISVLDY